MEQLTAALLSCPIPANYGLGTGDRDSNFRAEFRSLPRLCAAASLAALEGMSSPSAAADASSSSSSSSERTPEMLQERGVASSSSEQALSGASPTDLLLLQAASNAAAAVAAAGNDVTTGVLLPPGRGNEQQQQRRLELLRKALHEHSIGSGTDTYAASSSMSLRSVSTQASSLPDAAASSQRSLAHLSSTAAAGHSGFAAARSLDSSQCSPLSSPSSSASPSVSSPAHPAPLPSHTAASVGLVSRCAATVSTPAAAAAAARHLLKVVERRPWPAERTAELCSAADAFSAIDRDALAAAVVAVTAAAAGDVVAGGMQQQQLSQAAKDVCELSIRVAEATHSPATAAEATAVAAAVDAAANTAIAAEVAQTTMAATVTAEVLASVLADTVARAADGPHGTAGDESEAARHGLLTVAGGASLEAASSGSRTLALPSRRVSYDATEQAESENCAQPRKPEAGKDARRRKDGAMVVQLDVSSEAPRSSAGGQEGVNDSGAAATPSGGDIAAVTANSQPLSSETAALSAASAAASMRSPRAVAADAGVLACSDTPVGDVGTCSSAPSDLPSAAGAAAGDGRREAPAASDSRTERNTRKKRQRDAAAHGSWRGSGTSAAAAAASPAPAAETERLAGAADVKRDAPAAAAGSGEEQQIQKEKESSKGEKIATASRGAVHTGTGSGEKAYVGRKKEKRGAAVGGAATVGATARAGSDVGVRLDGRKAAASAADDTHEESQAAGQRAAAEMSAAGYRLVQEQIAAARSRAFSGGGGGDSRGGAAEKPGERDCGAGSLTQDSSAVAAAGAAPAAVDSIAATNAAPSEVEEVGDRTSTAAPVAKRKHAHEGGGHGKGKRVCSVPETGEASKGYVQEREGCETSLSEQIGYLAATTYFNGGELAGSKSIAGGAIGCAERSEQECSTMSCSSRNSSGELLVLSSSLSVDCGKQEQSVPQEVQEKQNEENQGGQVAAGNTCSRELAVACAKATRLDERGAGQHMATTSAGDNVTEAEISRTPEEESKKLSEESSPLASKAASAERQTERVREEGRMASVRQEQERERCDALQQQQDDRREGEEPEEQQQCAAVQEREEQQQDEEEEEGLVQDGGSSFLVENERSSTVWAKMDENSCVPPLHAYKSLSWTEGFSLPLGKIGRQKLLRQVRLKYHRNREHWRAKLHEKGFDVTSLPRMGVEQLWAVAQQMDLFEVACIIAHEHATRRQHRGGGGGGGGSHGATVSGHQHQQQVLPDMCFGGEVAEAAAVAAGMRGVGGRGRAEAAAVAASTLLSDTAACMDVTLNQLPSLVQAEASLRGVCPDKALKSALALLADNAAAAAAAAMPYASNSAHPEQEEGRGGFQQRSRGGAAAKEIPFLHSIDGSSAGVHGSSTPQGRSSRTRSRSRPDESRHSAAGTGGGKAAQGRRDAASDSVTPALEENREDDGKGGGSREEVYAASLGGAGTEPTVEEEGEVGGNHALLLLQEDEGDHGEDGMHEGFKESALLLLQQQAQREEMFAEEASTREEEGEGGRGFFGEVEHGIHASHEEAAAALAAAAAAAAERRATCGLIRTEGGVELDGQASTAAMAAAAESAALTWSYHGAARGGKKKARQEQMPSGGSVGELLSKVCAEALREAVACATDAGSRRYNLQTANPAACLRALGLAEAAATEEAGSGQAAAAAPAADAEAAAAATEAGGASRRDAGVAGVEKDEHVHGADLQEAHCTAAASCSRLQKNNWTDTDRELSEYVTQPPELQKQRQQKPQRVDANVIESGADEGEICGRDTEDIARLCAATRQQEGKTDAYRDGCGAVAAGFGHSEAEELALFLQQQLAASASTCAASERALCGSGELYSTSENGGAAAAAEVCKERLSELERQEHMYEGRSSNSSGAAPARVGKGKQRSHREKQRGEKDRQRGLVDQRQVKPKEIQYLAEEGGDDIREVYGKTQSRTEPADAAFAAGDVTTFLDGSRLTAGATNVRMARSGATSAPTMAAAGSAGDATPLAAAVGDLLWMTRGVSGEALKREQRNEGLSTQPMEREMLDEVAAAQNEDEKERKEAEELAETRRCMHDALSEIYMHLNNGLRGTTSASPRVIDRESCHAEGESCCDFSVEAGNRPANATRVAAAFAVDAGAAQEAPVPGAAAADAKTCTVPRGGCRKSAYHEREWVHAFGPEGGSDGSIDRSSCNGDNCSSYRLVSKVHSGSREAAVCGETLSALRGGVSEELYRRNARAREYFRLLVAERLQQRVNQLQGQLDEVKAQLRELVKPNGAEETLYAAVLADEAAKHMFAVEDQAAADCESRPNLPAEGNYCSCSVTGGG